MNRLFLTFILLCFPFILIFSQAISSDFTEDTNSVNRYLKLANGYYLKGDFEKANIYYDKVIYIYEEAVNIQKSSLGDQHPDIASGYCNIASLYIRKSEYNKALEYLLKALQIQQLSLGDSHKDLLYTYSDIGSLYNLKGNYAEAQKYFKNALRVMVQNSLNIPRRKAVILNNIGSIYFRFADYDSSLVYYFNALAIQRDSLGEFHHEIATSLNNIAHAYLKKDELDSALIYFEKSLAVLFENNGNDHIELAYTYRDIGLLNFKKRNFQIAIDNLLKSHEILNSRNMLSDSLLFKDSQIIGKAYYETGKFSKALSYYSNVTNNPALLKSLNSFKKSTVFSQLGVLYFLKEEYDSAIFYLEKAIEIRLNHTESLAVRLINDLNIVSNIYFETGSNQKALEFLLLIPEIASEKNYVMALVDLTTVFNNIGLNYASLGYRDLALDYFLKALDYYEENNGSDYQIIEPISANIAGLYAENGNYESALQYYQKLLEGKQERLGNKHPDLAVYYNNLGFLYKETGQYEEAIRNYERALKCELQSDRPNSEYLSMNYYNVSMVYLDMKDTETALKYLDMAMEIELSREEPDDYIVSMIFSNIGNIYNNQGRYNEAQKYLEDAIRKYQKIKKKDEIKVASLYTNMGNIYSIKGEYGLALDYYKLALDIMLAEITPKYSEISEAYSNIGGVYLSIGDFGKALENYQNALDIALEYQSENDLNIATIYNNIGIVYNNRNEYDVALGYYQKALRIQLKYEDAPFATLAKSYNNISGIYINKKDYIRALDYITKAMDIQEKILGSDHPDLAYTYSSYGNIYFKLKDYSKAIEFLRKALIIRLDFFGNKHPLVAASYNNLGIVFQDLDKYYTALQFYQKALISNVTDFNDTNIFQNPTFEKVLSKPTLLETLKKKANIFYNSFKKNPKSLNDLRASLTNYDLAISLIDALRNEYKMEESRLLLSEQAKSTFSGAVDAAIEMDRIKSGEYLEKAFEFVEKSKSTSLLTQLFESNARRFSGIPDTLLDYERKLKSDMLFFQTMIQNERSKKDAYDPELAGKWSRQYGRLTKDYDSLILIFERNYPRYFNLKYQDRIISSDRIQEKLNIETAILEYFVSEDNLYIFILTTDIFQVTRVPIDKGFEKLVLDYYRSLKKVETRKFAKFSTALYDLLIGPVIEYISNKKKIIVIPDDYLFYIPFETLVSMDFQDGFEDDFSKYDYLLNKYQISYHYSSNIWYNSLNESELKAKEEESFVGFAPVFKSDAEGEYTYADINVSSGNIDISSLPDIIYAQDEVYAIERLFEKKDYTSQGYYGLDAKESKFKNESHGYKYVHIATHGFSNDDEPDLSGLVFSLIPPGNSQSDTGINGRTEDGIMYSGEMYNLDLDAKLVVLSSCEGGVGKLVRGEGLIAMTRGFLYSGTPNIIFSIWRVPDVQTKDLMINLYKYILTSQEYSEALRNAKLDLIKDRKTAFPKFWAGFVLVGVD